MYGVHRLVTCDTIEYIFQYNMKLFCFIDTVYRSYRRGITYFICIIFGTNFFSNLFIFYDLNVL